LDIAVLFDATLLARKEQLRRNAGTPRSSIRVLVADDSLTVRTLHRNVLLAAGYDVSVSVDGEEAWRKMNEEPFDLLVSDINMPRMDGYELTKKVRAEESLRRTPVILVSNLGQREDMERGMEAGADEYIIKGKFDHEQLLEAVNRLTER
jgi:two-component system chemotaxis sensor kinase CheA